MANSTSANPLILDTAVANWADLNLPNVLPLDVYKIIWLSPASAGDTFSIKNSDNSVVFTSTCVQALSSQSFEFDSHQLKLTKAQGWYLSQISSGKLYIYFR